MLSHDEFTIVAWAIGLLALLLLFTTLPNAPVDLEQLR